MSIAGYGTPSGPGGYQNWGAPPGPQGQQMAPPQWGSNYPPQQTGYGSYGECYFITSWLKCVGGEVFYWLIVINLY